MRLALMFAIVLVAGTSAGAAAQPATLTGAWALELQRDANVTYVADCVWEQDGDRLSGGCTSGFGPVAAVHGTVTKADVAMTLTIETGPALTLTCAGQLNERRTALTGVWRLVDGDGRVERGRFIASKRPGAVDSNGSLR